MSEECYSYIEDGNPIEKYFEHIDAALIVWREIRQYYYDAVTRVLELEEFDPVEFAIVVHDLGKLTREYKTHRGKFFRHELFSAYSCYKILKRAHNEDQKALPITLSVLLHHEPILLSAYAGNLGENYVAVSNIKKILHESNLSLACNPASFGKYCLGDRINEFIDKWKGIGQSELKDDAFKLLKEIILKSTVGPQKQLTKIRAKAAALLYPLTVCDSIAAEMVRGDCKNVQREKKGTWVTERAKSGAEQIKYEDLKKKVVKELGLKCDG